MSISKHELLVKTADEMNKKMGLDPIIDSKRDDNAIISAIRENCKELKPTDFSGGAALSQMCCQVFAKLEIPEYKKLMAERDVKKQNKKPPTPEQTHAKLKTAKKVVKTQIKKAAAKLAPKVKPEPKKTKKISTASAAVVQEYCVKHRTAKFKDVIAFMATKKLDLKTTTVNNILYHAKSVMACAERLGLLKTK